MWQLSWEGQVSNVSNSKPLHSINYSAATELESLGFHICVFILVNLILKNKGIKRRRGGGWGGGGGREKSVIISDAIFTINTITTTTIIMKISVVSHIFYFLYKARKTMFFSYTWLSFLYVFSILFDQSWMHRLGCSNMLLREDFVLPLKACHWPVSFVLLRPINLGWTLFCQ